VPDARRGGICGRDICGLDGSSHWLILRVGVGADNVLRLSLPLPPALIRSRVGVLVSEFVRVSAGRRVEAVAHALTVSAPLHTVGAQGNRDSVPLLEVITSTIPAEDTGQVFAATLGQLLKEARIGSIGGRGVGHLGRLNVGHLGHHLRLDILGGGHHGVCRNIRRCKVLGVSLSIPLPPALIGAGVGVLVSELVGVGAALAVEAVAKPLPVSAPLHTICAQGNRDSVPLLEVITSTIPAKGIG